MDEIEITVDELEKFRGCFVSVGIRDKTGNEDDLFWYYGTITDMDPEHIKLRFRRKHGFKIIAVRDIKAIESRGGFRY